MLIPITEELRNICNRITDQNLTLDEWCLIESDDMFQTEHFVGGFDATEKEFTFSYFGDKEYWFQISLGQVFKICNEEISDLKGTVADI